MMLVNLERLEPQDQILAVDESPIRNRKMDDILKTKKPETR
jgi:hypothetical protein